MKNSTPIPIKSRLLYGISLVLLFAGIYFGAIRKSTAEEELTSSNPKTKVLSKDAPVSFVSQGSEFLASGTDLVATYSQLYGKYQMKVYANWKFSMPTDLEIEALRLEAIALDELYTRMTPEERRKVNRVSFPYAKLEVAGKVVYKKFEELTQKERESLGC
jgi:hypothetical protein